MRPGVNLRTVTNDYYRVPIVFFVKIIQGNFLDPDGKDKMSKVVSIYIDYRCDIFQQGMRLKALFITHQSLTHYCYLLFSVLSYFYF